MTGIGSRSARLRLAAVAVLTIATGQAPTFAVPLPPARPIDLSASTVPLPPERPEEDGPPMPPPAPRVTATPSRPPEKSPNGAPTPVATPAPPEPDLACAGLLSGGTVVGTRVAPIAEGGGCGIAAPVRVDAVVLRDGRRVPLVPAATMRCDLAASLADWIRDDVVPATGADGDLSEIADAAAYVCRSRNRLPGERLSEHARGNAIDVLGLRFASRRFDVADPAARPFWAKLKASACRRFATVLGPGSDAFHAADLHLDLEHRRSGAHLCQWDAS